MTPALRCEEALRQMPAYLADALEPPVQDEVAAHFACCAECALELAAERRIDQLLARAVDEATPPSSPLRFRIRARIADSLAPRRQRWWSFAYACAAVVVLGTGLWFGTGAWQAHMLCVDAADDHKTEVTDGQTRRWRTTPDEIDALAQQVGGPQVPLVLAGQDLKLSRGRLCRLRGSRFLHLVYEGASREVSVFLAADPQVRGASLAVHREQEIGIDVATVRRGPAVVVVASEATGSISADVAAGIAQQLH